VGETTSSQPPGDGLDVLQPDPPCSGEVMAELREGSPDQNVWTVAAGRARGYLKDLTRVRLASHAALVLVVALVLALSQVDLPEWELSRPEPPQAEQVADEEEALPLITFWPNRGGSPLGSGDSLSRAAVPFTTIPDRPRLEIITYMVQAGDTLSGIADSYGLALDTVMWATGLELCPQLLRVNQEVLILPTDGVHHTVEEGDTLSDIAARYLVEPSAIMGWEPNGLANEISPLAPGKVLIIPGGLKEDIAAKITSYSGEEGEPSRIGSGRFAWPINGRIQVLDWFGTNTLGGRPGAAERPWPHKGVDIAAYLGTPLLAADAGTVSVAQYGGYNGGYGNYVLINHGNGLSTLYAHMSSLGVQSGEVVAKGQRIGAAGATGMATGAHLHFEIRYNGVQRNPLCFLSAASQ